MGHKLVGISLSYMSVWAVYLIYLLLTDYARVDVETFIGLWTISFFATPFIIVGLILSLVVEQWKIQSVILHTIVYAVGGLLIGVMLCVVYAVNADDDMAIFFLLAPMTGAVAYYLGSTLITNTKWQRGLALGVLGYFVLAPVIGFIRNVLTA